MYMNLTLTLTLARTLTLMLILILRRTLTSLAPMAYGQCIYLYSLDHNTTQI